MANSIGALTVDMTLNVNDKTAIMALKVVELFANQHGFHIIGRQEQDGWVTFRFDGLSNSEEKAHDGD